VSAHEPSLLCRALQNTSVALSGSHPQKILRTLQANVFLANYLFRNNRFLEGRFYHHAAVLLVIESGLHKIRSGAPTSTDSRRLISETGTILPPSRNSVEEGERIDAFWNVYIMDKAWSAISDTSSLMTDSGGHGTQIDTPWPLDAAQYKQVNIFNLNIVIYIDAHLILSRVCYILASEASEHFINSLPKFLRGLRKVYQAELYLRRRRCYWNVPVFKLGNGGQVCSLLIVVGATTYRRFVQICSNMNQPHFSTLS
jgi:hypothetical protein